MDWNIEPGAYDKRGWPEGLQLGGREEISLLLKLWEGFTNVSRHGVMKDGLYGE